MSNFFRLHRSKTRRSSIASAFITLIIALFFTAAFNALAAENPIIPNFAKVADGIYRGGRPRKNGVQELKRLGIKTIVNLKGNLSLTETDDATDERQWTTETGLKYVYVPMSPSTAPMTKSIDEALKSIIDPANQPVFVHCYRGSDRTGTVIAAYRITHDGWDIEKAYEKMNRYGHAYRTLSNWKYSLLPFVERAKEAAIAPASTGR